MSGKFRLFIAVCFVLLNAGLIFGQAKTIEKRQFQEILGKANANLNKETYRTKTIKEEFENGKLNPAKTTRSIAEAVTADRFRWLDTFSDGKKREVILVDEKRYKRENGGQWEIDDSVGLGGGGNGDCGANESETYKVSENIKLGGKLVDLYEVTTKFNESSCGSRGKAEVSTERFWITKDGLMMKTEYRFEDLEKKSMTREISVYEHNLKIKIEAPLK